MSYHLVCQVGQGDQHTPAVQAGEVVHVVSLERPGDPNTIRIRNSAADVLQTAHLVPPPAAMDLLNLSMAVYAADLGIPRGTAFDRWTRDLHLHMPVQDLPLWQSVRPTLCELLGFLSGDHWNIAFRKRTKAAAAQQVALQDATAPPSAVSLFSGGLDSFVGAIDRLEHADTLALVGHHAAGMTNSAQAAAYEAIAKSYHDKAMLLPFYVQAPEGVKGRDKKTTRARSFLFLGLGVTVASAINKVPLLVPENGLISINAPLLDPRMGSLSTRTTHPHYIQLYRDMVDRLALKVCIQTPYRFLTKGQMVQGVLNSDAFLQGVSHTQSCSHPEVGRYRGKSPDTHCGYCVPCIIRRAALTTVGLDNPEDYVCNILTKKKRTDTVEGRDLLAFLTALERLKGATRRQLSAEVLSSGPIPPEELSQYVDVYARGMDEVRNLLVPARVKV